ncbi:MAG: RluA family pseudouridine synthase [Clostridia bacterium]|nr:RluA family pseudouridine synthase [Clostridia bacterium]
MKSFIVSKTGKLTKLALNSIEDLSYSALLKALRKKDVKVNGKRIKEDLTLNVGDVVEVYFVDKKQDKFDVVYLDENLIIVYKKSGYLAESVFENVKEQYSSAGFIHRLDRNTDGLMVFSLNENSERELLSAFKNRTIDKKYNAWVVGVPAKKESVETAYLLKDKDASKVQIFDKKVEGAVQIKTGYKVLREKPDSALLEVILYTGKTHQIRAHLSHLGHPIIGDGKYGDYGYNKRANITSQMLTATELTFHFDKASALHYLDNKTFYVPDKAED